MTDGHHINVVAVRQIIDYTSPYMGILNYTLAEWALRVRPLKPGFVLSGG